MAKLTDNDPAFYIDYIQLRAKVMRHEAILILFKTHPVRLVRKALVGKLFPWFTAVYRQTRPQRPPENRLWADDFSWYRSITDLRLWAVSFPPAQLAMTDAASHGFDRISQPRLAARQNRLIIVHAFYEREALQIIELLKGHSGYDIVVTTPKPALAALFLRELPQILACVIVPNNGRDVLPFILLTTLLDVNHYQHFIKVHTKRSGHVTDGGAWFYENLQTLIGSPGTTDYLLNRVPADKPALYGCHSKKLDDHLINNRLWLNQLISEPLTHTEINFIPGTMFIGSGPFLALLAQQNLWKYPFEVENGQLDGCIHHAVERLLGYIAVKNGGICESINTLMTTPEIPKCKARA